MKTSSDILDFWFNVSGQNKWYQKSDEFDALIRREFEETALQLAGEVSRKVPHNWEANVDGALAVIIALDQFPRNMYRGTKAAFAWDPLSLGAAKRLVAKNHDLKIALDRRAFVYMPYMHSENIEDQDSCVSLVDQRLESENTLHHAKEHRKVIARFGRFPHRNEILGRATTASETTFLETGGYSP